ncbi:type II secretion system F family protein [Paraherbaspirillum soli]|uniref:Type II secretion system F family protein n=1 Tax=Paraherbaspirillum soli TaxID=631222 RepID=A0ABW0MBW6_9BURK
MSILLPKPFARRSRAKRLRRIEMQMPDVLLAVAGELRAGADLPAALAAAAQQAPLPMAAELALLLREIQLGAALEPALKNMERRLPLHDLMKLVAAISVAREVGGNLAGVLESAAKTLREKHRIEARIRNLALIGKVQGLAMCCLPLLLLLALHLVEPLAMAPLFHSPFGWGTLAAIAVMEILGYLTIRKITDIDV